MVDLVVIRGAGDKCGDDIVDPLITQIFVGVSRGRAELDRHATEKAEVRYTTIFRPGVRLGQLAELQDTIDGTVFRAKIVGIEHVKARTGGVTRLTVEKVINF